MAALVELNVHVHNFVILMCSLSLIYRAYPHPRNLIQKEMIMINQTTKNFIPKPILPSLLPKPLTAILKLVIKMVVYLTCSLILPHNMDLISMINTVIYVPERSNLRPHLHRPHLTHEWKIVQWWRLLNTRKHTLNNAIVCLTHLMNNMYMHIGVCIPMITRLYTVIHTFSKYPQPFPGLLLLSYIHIVPR